MMGEMAALLHELEQLCQHCDDQGAELQRLTRRNVTFLPYREHKLRKFSGAETFEEWEVDAQAAISGSGMSLEEQSGFLFNKLGESLAVYSKSSYGAPGEDRKGRSI